MSRNCRNARGDATHPASASEPDVKLAPPPSLAIADAPAEHAHVVLVAVQLTGVQSVESYVCSTAFQRRHEGSTVTAQLICVDHSSDTSTSIPSAS